MLSILYEINSTRFGKKSIKDQTYVRTPLNNTTKANQKNKKEKNQSSNVEKEMSYQQNRQHHSSSFWFDCIRKEFVWHKCFIITKYCIIYRKLFFFSCNAIFSLRCSSQYNIGQCVLYVWIVTWQENVMQTEVIICNRIYISLYYKSFSTYTLMTSSRSE